MKSDRSIKVEQGGGQTVWPPASTEHALAFFARWQLTFWPKWASKVIVWTNGSEFPQINAGYYTNAMWDTKHVMIHPIQDLSQDIGSWFDFAMTFLEKRKLKENFYYQKKQHLFPCSLSPEI